jgi:molybdenum cofactor synthesis domain-containing protein
VSVITISDRASRGEYPDRSGPEIVSILQEAFPDVRIDVEVVPDEVRDIVAAFERHRQADFILTTGGTGISSRDVTPEATRSYCERELPGIAEALRAESYRETPTAVLSRGAAGIKGRTIIVNFPGSVKAVRLCTRVLVPVMEHAQSMLRGEGH